MTESNNVVPEVLAAPVVLSKLSPTDNANLQEARKTHDLAMEMAQKDATIAQQAYRLYVMTLYVKYGMSETDKIDQDGNIIKAAP